MAEDKIDDKFQFSFPERVYVGVKANETFNIEEPPLGFMVADGTDSAAKKRKKSVDDWCVSGIRQNERGGHPPRVITNEPMEGFEFDKMIERRVTSNKVFRITDPRGFQLEIPSENLADILRNAEINRGLLIGKFIWGRRQSYNWLIREDHPAYKLSVTEKIDRPIKPGDHVRQGAKDYIYVGPVFTYNVGYEQILPEGQSRYYSYGKPETYRIITRSVTGTSHLFICASPDGTLQTHWRTKELDYEVKSDIKKLVIVGEFEAPVFPADKTVINGQSYVDRKILFSTREALKAFSMTDAEAKDFVYKNEEYSRDHNFTERVHK